MKIKIWMVKNRKGKNNYETDQLVDKFIVFKWNIQFI